MPGPHSARLIAAMGALGLLTGCVSFGSKPPPQLLTLSSPGIDPSIEPQGPAIAVLDPETPRKLDAVRVPVQVNATSIAYVKDAQWVDTPRHLFGKLLTERFAANGILTLDPAQFPSASGRRLVGTLSEFGIDAKSKMAIVTYEATLTTGESGDIKRKRFTASMPVRHIKANRIGAPIDKAAQQVAEEVVAWVKLN